MGRIVSSVGLVTGTNIDDTVKQLIAIQARPRDLVVNRNKTIEDQRTALTGLTAQLVAVQLTVRKFITLVYIRNARQAVVIRPCSMSRLVARQH